MVIRNGYLLWKGDQSRAVTHVNSCTKSIVATVFLKMVSDGLCDWDDKAADSEGILADAYADVSLYHLGTMSSGYNAVGGDKKKYKGQRDGFGWYTCTDPGPPLFPPGERFLYWNENYNMFARVLTKVARQDIGCYLSSKIAKPIGLTDWEWPINGQADGYDVRPGAAGFHVSAYQLAKVGLLWLNKGKWKRQQLIAESIVEKATSQPDHIDGYGYGLGVRLNGRKPSGERVWPDGPETAYYFRGHSQDRLYVLPEWNMLFVRLGHDNETSSPKLNDVERNEFLRMLGQALSPATHKER